jgi:hypothetical protein
LEVTKTSAQWAPSAQLAAELHRVGVTNGTAGLTAGVLALDLGEKVTFMDSTRQSPRRRWNGTEREALMRLGKLADGAGVPGFWAAFLPGRASLVTP